VPTIEKRLSSGSKFETMAAYSRALVDDRYIYISGTVGLDPETKEMPEGAADQARNIFRIVEAVLAGERVTLEQVVRSRVYLVDAADLEVVVPVLAEKFGDCPPTNTTLICGIPAPGARVEIEITALRFDRQGLL
jgi:enamine deaminase RidA (YjgF/YER057c/UK114 family)